jgi:hypothetical protein
MDAPWTQRGENTSNNWYDKGFWLHGEGVAVMVDNFAIPAATLRGLFDYDYKADRLILRPRVPGSITEYTQKEPVRFGEKNLFITCKNGGTKIKSVKVNGKKLKAESPDEVVLLYSDLPEKAEIEITTIGGWDKLNSYPDYPVLPALVSAAGKNQELPDSLRAQYATLTRFENLIAQEPGAQADRAFVRAAIEAYDAVRDRRSLDPGPGYYRPTDEQKKIAMVRSFVKAAKGMYRGLEKRMADYSLKEDPVKQHISKLFMEAGK